MISKVIISLKKKRLIFSKIYSVISVFATLTIFSGLILFIYGKIVKNNRSDNDLVMKQIKDEVQNEEICSLNTADIHGFGNTSIIVTTSENTGAGIGNNRLLILDVVDNDILRDMNDFFHTKSNFKTTFSYSLSSEEIHFWPETQYVLDILGNSAKELIVKYYVWGSNYSANCTAIFSYSYKDEAYELIGTYPENNKYDLKELDKHGNVKRRYAKIIETCFNDNEKVGFDFIRCTDGKTSFNLNCGADYNDEYWIREGNRNELVIVTSDPYFEQKTYINIYQPIYDEADRALKWNLLYSEYAKLNAYNYSKDDLARELMNMLHSQVTFIESY